MTKTIAMLPLALLTLAASGCEDEDQQGRSLDLECQATYEARGQDVLAEHAACETDDDCAIIASGPGCLSPFLCGVSVAAGLESAFLEAANAVIDDYTATCGPFCSIADCTSTDGLRPACDAQTHLCSFQAAQQPGAVEAP